MLKHMFSIIGGSDNFSNPSFQNYKQDPVVSLEGSLITSFVDKHNTASPALKTTLLCNMPGKHKVRDDILHELERCDSFSIAVAFITMSGLEPLLMTLQELEKSGILGRILTSSYLNFSEPKAIRKLLTLKNLQTRIYNAPSSEGGVSAHQGLSF